MVHVCVVADMYVIHCRSDGRSFAGSSIGVVDVVVRTTGEEIPPRARLYALYCAFVRKEDAVGYPDVAEIIIVFDHGQTLVVVSLKNNKDKNADVDIENVD